MAKHKSQIAGRWRNSSMTEWDNDFIDAEVPEYFEFGKDVLGDFQFGYVRYDIDYFCQLHKASSITIGDTSSHSESSAAISSSSLGNRSPQSSLAPCKGPVAPRR